MEHRSSGFTLIEMIVVIVILAILSVTALPKFLTVEKDAYARVLQQISVSVKSANDLLFIKSQMDSYSVEIVNDRLTDIDMDLDGTFDHENGIDVRLKYNYLDNTHIYLMIDISDEFLLTEDNPDFTYIGYDIDEDGSSSDDNCYFKYTQAQSPTIPPEYEVETSGC